MWSWSGLLDWRISVSDVEAAVERERHGLLEDVVAGLLAGGVTGRCRSAHVEVPTALAAVPLEMLPAERVHELALIVFIGFCPLLGKPM